MLNISIISHKFLLKIEGKSSEVTYMFSQIGRGGETTTRYDDVS